MGFERKGVKGFDFVGVIMMSVAGELCQTLKLLFMGPWLGLA